MTQRRSLQSQEWIQAVQELSQLVGQDVVAQHFYLLTGLPAFKIRLLVRELIRRRQMAAAEARWRQQMAELQEELNRVREARRQLEQQQARQRQQHSARQQQLRISRPKTPFLTSMALQVGKCLLEGAAESAAEDSEGAECVLEAVGECAAELLVEGCSIM